MSDTTTITPEERALWLAEAQPKNIDYYEPIDFEMDKRIRRLLNALEQAEARAEQAEARVKSRNNHIHRLLGEALENERNLDGMKSRWQTAEAENARLTKERDWLAEKCAMHCHDKDGDENMCSYDTCGMFNCWHVSECEWKEAARKAVAGEVEE